MIYCIMCQLDASHLIKKILVKITLTAATRLFFFRGEIQNNILLNTVPPENNCAGPTQKDKLCFVLLPQPFSEECFYFVSD